MSGRAHWVERSPFRRRILDPARTWWRQLTIDLFWVANLVLAVAVAAFLVAILSSHFTVSLKWLWGGVLCMAVAGLLHVAGAMVQGGIDRRAEERRIEDLRRSLGRDTPDDL